MTFSTGLYQQNVAPQQQDVRLSAPLMRQQVDSLASVFGQGLEAFSEILNTREQYKQEMAAIAQANDKRAAQLAASGISSTDAINMAWEETRYMVPKTWGDVGKQNAISDLAAKANNGWVGGKSSAIVIETAMADIAAIKENGIDGVALDDLNWADGTGLKKLVAATRPKTETMIALGPNATWVRNQIQDRVLHLANVYTEKQRQETLDQYHADGRDQMENLYMIDLNGGEISPYLHQYVTNYIKKNPAKAKEAGYNIIVKHITSESFNKNMADGVTAFEKSLEFATAMGIELDPVEMQKLISREAQAGNEVRLSEITERNENIAADLDKVPYEQYVSNPAIPYQIMMKWGVPLDEIEQLSVEDDLLNNDSNFNAALNTLSNNIRLGTRTYDDGMNLVRSLAPYSVALQSKWGSKFLADQNAYDSQQRAKRSDSRDEKRLRLAYWDSSHDYLIGEMDQNFDPSIVHDVNGELKSFKSDVSKITKRDIRRGLTAIKWDFVNGDLTEEGAQQLGQTLIDINYGGLLLNPDSFIVPAPPPQSTQPQPRPQPFTSGRSRP